MYSKNYISVCYYCHRYTQDLEGNLHGQCKFYLEPQFLFPKKVISAKIITCEKFFTYVNLVS